MSQINFIFATLLMTLMGLVIASPLTPRDYPTGPLTWRGNVTENGPIVTRTGTGFEDIERQISTNVTEFKFDNTWFARSWNESSRIEARSVDPKPQCRSTADHGRTYSSHIADGSVYVATKTGDCHVAGKTCTRISCSFNSGIYFCNDNPGDVWVPCTELAHYASLIIAACTQYDFGAHGTYVNGQAFNAAGWNVFVGATNVDESGC